MDLDQIVVGHCTIELVRGDITLIPVDAIVNAANSMLAGGGGVDGAIHAAGGPSLMQELRRYNGCSTGEAVVTGAGLLPARYVFHAVGPVYRGGDSQEAGLLTSCYQAVLRLAGEYKCESISIPSISTGIYGYPIADAASIAFSTVLEHMEGLASSLRVVKLVQFNEASYAIYRELMEHFPSRRSSVQTS